MRFYIFLFFNLILINVASAQSLLPEKVSIQTDDENIIAFIKPVKGDIEPSPEKYYYWYSAGKLRTTQGGFSGKLLNGPYESFYQNKAIKEQGKFKKGLKSGTWKTWFENGNLKEVAEWRLGNKTGHFSEYDESGKIKSAGRYKKGKLQGKLLSYLAKDSVAVSHYKEGKLVVKKEKVRKDKLRLKKYVTKVKGWVKKAMPKTKGKNKGMESKK